MNQYQKISVACMAALFACVFTNAQNTGIGISTPDQKLDVNGKLKIGNDNRTPTAGTVRFNNALKDFEGFNGTEWKSLTASYANAPFYNISPQPDDWGFTVAIGSTLAAIAAPAHFDSGGDGLVYIFRKVNSSWLFVETLVPYGVYNSLFGASLAMNENYLVVGSPSYTVSGNVRGRVSLYKRSGNSFYLLNHFQPQTPVNGETFGGSLSMYGNYVAVGCRSRHELSPATTSNNVYLFTIQNDGLLQQQVLTNPGNPAQEEFGMSVAIDSTVLVIGAPGATNFGNTQRGKVYVYKYAGASSYTYTNNIGYAGYGNNGDRVGATLSLSGNRLVIGAPGFDITPLINIGAFFICTKDGSGNFTSSSLIIFTNPGDGQEEYFGQAVCVYKDVVIAGSNSNVHQYIFNGVNWEYSRQLNKTFPVPGIFGSTSIAISDLNYIIGDGPTRLSRGIWVIGDCRY